MTAPTEVEWPSILALLHRVQELTPKSLRQVAREIGIAHPTLLNMLSDDPPMPHPRNRTKVAGWLAQEVEDLQLELSPGEETVLGRVVTMTVREPTGSYDDAVAVEAIIGDPNMLRRAMGVIPKDDYKTRIAIIREYEDVLIENGFPPPRWPQWFRELRKEILDRGE